MLVEEMKLFLLTCGSFALTAAVVGNAFYQKNQFYPSVVYITKSNPSMAVSGVYSPVQFQFVNADNDFRLSTFCTVLVQLDCNTNLQASRQDRVGSLSQAVLVQCANKMSRKDLICLEHQTLLMSNLLIMAFLLCRSILF